MSQDLMEPVGPVDLNRPDHARAYVEAWTDPGHYELKDARRLLRSGTDEDYLRVARQLFLFADDRPVPRWEQ